MKIFKGLFFTVAAFFIFSCTQLNLKNPVGAVNVSLPSSSRMIIEEGQTVNSFEKINYLISLYSSSGALVDKKMAPEGSSVTFPDVAEGSYVVKAFCNATSNGKEECIAAGFKSAEVKGGEVTPVIIELSYNRPDKIDVNRSSIRYTGKTEFSSENEMAAYVSDNFKDFLSAEIVFTNGWSETVVDADRFFVEKNQVSQIPGGTFATGGTGGATEVIVSGGKDPCQFKVTLSLNENITKELIVTLYVVKELLNNDPIVIPDLTVGLSEDNPCRSFEDLKTANANASNGATIYLASGTFEMAETFPVTKTITLLAVDGDVTIKRTAGGAYIYVGDGEDPRSITLNINDSGASNKFIFTDGVVTDSPFIYGPNENKSVVAYRSEFNGIKSDVISVKNATISYCKFNSNTSAVGIINSSVATISGCTFEENSSTGGIVVCDRVDFVGCSFDSNTCTRYGAIHVASYCSATVDGCTFSGNESTQNSGYGDIYLAKGSEDTTLTLSGTVTTDIGIYVANESCGDPEIKVDGIELSSNKLNIKLSSWPEAESITLFVKNNGTFTSVGDMDSKYTFVVFPDSVSTMPTEDGDDQYMTSLDGTGKEYMVIKY